MADNHPTSTQYHIVRATSNSDAAPIQDSLDQIPGAPFGAQASFSQEGAAIALDAKSHQSWADFVTLVPKLSEFVFQAGDLPTYLTLGDEDVSHAQALTEVTTTGASGSAWSAPSA